ncbi:MAG: pyridoxamine 5'-phosphate oxidase [Chitinophagales bacterium]|nr:pyridoxamine 5'-phosphate oxidase [Chitinophagales bacterium]
MGKDLSDYRSEYDRSVLEDKQLPDNPITLFDKWFQDLIEEDINELNAVTLATSTTDGIPSARIVLMKSYNDSGFTFYTNYESKKGRELEENPHASLLFYWPVLQRQVRIEGRVVKTSGAESDKYFDSRPEGSRVSAIISKQSKEISSREELEKKVQEFSSEIKRPEYWGGYRLEPHTFEFWQGRQSRLHDRICYVLESTKKWRRYRIAP